MKAFVLFLDVLAVILFLCGQWWPAFSMACLGYALWPDRVAEAIDLDD